VPAWDEDFHDYGEVVVLRENDLKGAEKRHEFQHLTKSFWSHFD
jgi:hypothetical protein